MNQKRGRGRPGGGGGGGGGGGQRRPHQQLGTGRSLDSNGPEVKLRGTAHQIFDRYCQLARDANASGDRVAAENFLQHAEHYYRVLLANGALPPRTNGQPGQPGANPEQQGGQQPQGAMGESMAQHEPESQSESGMDGGMGMGGGGDEQPA
jgi:Domain of unknown function (DUF4167)